MQLNQLLRSFEGVACQVESLPQHQHTGAAFYRATAATPLFIEATQFQQMKLVRFQPPACHTLSAARAELSLVV